MATNLVPIVSLPAQGGIPSRSAASTAQPDSSESKSPDFTAILAQMNLTTGIHNDLARPTPPSFKGGPVQTERRITLPNLTKLLQSGVSLGTIIARIKAQLGSAVQKALPASATGASAQIQSALMQSLTNALSPPANGPPQTAAESATALAGRLTQWLAGIAGEAQSAAGQQNDIAGKILDANSAKDLPAQQKPPTSGALDVASLAQSILASVTASPAPQATPPPAPGPPTAGSAALQPAPTSSATTITMASAPDLLARMIVRAASVDAQFNPPAPAAEATAPANAQAPSQASTPSAIAARFAAAFANIVEAPQMSSFGDAPSQNFSQGASTGHDTGLSGESNPTATSLPIRSDAQSGFSLASAPITPTLIATAPTPSVQLPAQIDTSALVEQLVKSMTMRTLPSGVSEMNLHLTPANLGAITMKLTVNGSSITANVVAQNADVQNALMSGQQQLARSLNAAGMTLSGFSVDVSGGQTGQGGHDRSSGFGRHYTIHELPAADASAAGTSSSALPPLVGASTLELFNHLA